MKNFQAAVLCVIPLVAFLVCPVSCRSAHSVERREIPESKLEALKKNLEKVGELTKTQHKVEGTVWKLNESIVLIENFVYDGKGFGVFINVATEGDKPAEWIRNRKMIGHPDPDDVSNPIEKEYKKEDKKWLVIRLPQDIKASDIKWLSVWCDIFNISFGHVVFGEN